MERRQRFVKPRAKEDVGALQALISLSCPEEHHPGPHPHSPCPLVWELHLSSGPGPPSSFCLSCAGGGSVLSTAAGSPGSFPPPGWTLAAGSSSLGPWAPCSPRPGWPPCLGSSPAWGGVGAVGALCSSSFSPVHSCHVCVYLQIAPCSVVPLALVGWGYPACTSGLMWATCPSWYVLAGEAVRKNDPPRPAECCSKPPVIHSEHPQAGLVLWRVLKHHRTAKKSRLTGEGPQELLRSLLEELFWCLKVGPERVHLYPLCKLFPSAVPAVSAWGYRGVFLLFWQLKRYKSFWHPLGSSDDAPGMALALSGSKAPWALETRMQVNLTCICSVVRLGERSLQCGTDSGVLALGWGRCKM